MLDDYDKAIASSKIFLREFSSDPNVAEVLALIANAYAKLGENSDAEYFFDRLFTEHSDSVYIQWGYIYKGEMLELSEIIPKAVDFYMKALNETVDINVATYAGYKLAYIYLVNSQSKESAKYTQKIAKVKPEYFSEKLDVSIRMMDIYVDIEDYKSAATIAKCLVDSMSDIDVNYELYLKNIGIWLSYTDDKKAALKALNKYLEVYDEGEFDAEIRIVKDSLFFTNVDENASTKLQNYEKLISKYQDDTIGSRAIYKKAKLLLELKRYNDVLAMQDTLYKLDTTKYKDIDNIINDSAIGSMENALKNKECNGVLEIAAKYKIKLSDSWDDGIYECAMKGGDYTLAKSSANKNLKSEDIDFRKKWLFRYIKVDFTTGNYTNVISASKELITLIKDNKEVLEKDLDLESIYHSFIKSMKN